MATQLSPRLFSDDAAVRHVGNGLLACTLTREEWTHEAHLAACAWLVIERPDIGAERNLRSFISRFNESIGGANDATQGYHHVITLTFLRGVHSYLARNERDLPLVELVNGLLVAPEGQRDWPLRFYSEQLLFSPQVRLSWVEPDLESLPAV